MHALDPSTYLKEVLGPYLGAPEPPGLFERYLLEPDDDDDAAIEARLREVKALWDRTVNTNPKYGDLIRLLSGKHTEAGLVLGDPDARMRAAAEASARRAARQQASAQALAEWEQALEDWIAEHRGLAPGKRATFEQAAARAGLDPAYVAARLDAAPVPPPPAALEPSLRKQVRDALAALAQETGDARLGLSLFHALGLPGITPDTAEVSARHQQALAANRGVAQDHAQNVRAIVLSHAKLLLLERDPDAYVEGLVADAREALDAAALRAAASGGQIDEVEAQQLVQQGVARGLTEDLARRVVTELAQVHDVPLVLGAPVDYVACSRCNEPHRRDNAGERCRRCGAALFVDCPQDGCGERNDASAMRCSRCGTDLHRHTAATRKAAELAGLVGSGRLEQAQADLAEVRAVLGETPEVAAATARLEQALTRARAGWKAVDAALGERRLYAARERLRELAADASDVRGPEGLVPGEQLAQVERRLTEVEELVARARRAGGNAREDGFAAALELAADAREAEQELARIVPAPPSAVSVAVDERGAVLSWSPSPSPGVRYAVTRSGPSGSEQLAVVPGLRIEDPAVGSGAIVRYAVAAVRGATASAPAQSEDVFVAREVGDLTSADGDGEVRLAWRPVGAAGRVVVERATDGGDERRELDAGSAGLLDRDVVNGRRYAYRVRVEYLRPDGSRHLTEGRTVFGQPAARPEPVTLSAEGRDGGIVLTFAAPAHGTVAVLRCTERPDLEPGADVEPARLGDLGERLALDGAGARDDDRTPGIRWYLPVTLAGGTGVAGPVLRHLALPAIDGVRAAQSAGAVRLTWVWPDGVRIVVVAWRRDRQPTGPDDPAALRAEVRLGSYRDAGFEIPAPGGEPLFATVFPATRVDGELVTAAVAPRGARVAVGAAVATDVRYRVRRAGLRRRRLEIEVVEPQSGALPALVLVARAGDMLPRDAQDGDVLARLGADGSRQLAVDLGDRPRPLAVRLFLDAGGATAAHRLFDPAVDELKIR